ncbi:MAG: putative PDDEXK endonuclease, partial [Gammaproteobacteria bacterium]
GWGGRTVSVEGFRQVGDLAPNGPRGEAFRRRIGVECKHQRDISLWQLWAGGKLLEWWDKLLVESENAGVWPLLIVRENRQPITAFSSIDLTYPEQLAHMVRMPWLGMVAFPLAEMLRCDPDAFLSMVNLER